jgi:predicted membrane protein
MAMPMVLTLVLLLVILYLFWLFIKTASPYQMGRMLATIACVIGACGLLFLVFTGRLPLALLILIVLWPFMAIILDRRKKMIMLRHHKPDEDGTKKEQVKNDFDENS